MLFRVNQRSLFPTITHPLYLIRKAEITTFNCLVHKHNYYNVITGACLFFFIKVKENETMRSLKLIKHKTNEELGRQQNNL